MGAALALLCLVVAPLGPVSKQNTAAETVAHLSRELGIDFDRSNPKGEHPTKEAAAAYSRAGIGAWLETEIARDDDSISEPPASVTEYVEAHRDTLWAVVAALEKDSPRWGEDSTAEEDGLPSLTNRLLPTIILERILVGAALFEEREGRAVEADRALEASWSLGRPVSERPEIIGQLISLAIARFQAGALRKLKTPSLAWMGRLGSGDPYRAMIECIQHEHDDRKDPSGLSEPTMEAWQRAFKALFETIRKMTPCELSGATEEDIERMASQAAGILPSREKQIVAVLSGIAVPNLVSAVRRAGRLSVDRELTLQILRLRLAKEGARDARWPTELGNPWSDVCPGVGYGYKTDGASVDVQFGGSAEAGTDRVLPLSFHSGGSRLLPTFTPAPTSTPTPVPAEEP